jgi:hypothetical protein
MCTFHMVCVNCELRVFVCASVCACVCCVWSLHLLSVYGFGGDRYVWSHLWVHILSDHIISARGRLPAGLD